MPVLSPAVLIVDPSAVLAPGDCDIAGCTQHAKYSIGNYYLCADCLIESCDEGRIPVGTTVYRVMERGSLF